MHLSFPEVQDEAAIKKTVESKKSIQKSAKTAYYRYKTVFDRVGVRMEDVESILTCNAYVAFSKNLETSPKILANFLRQRSIKMANSCRTLIEGIVENSELPEGMSVDDLLSDESNPESIMLAKEEAAFRSRDIQSKLVVRSADYIQKFLDKNSEILDSSKIKAGDVLDMVNSNAIEFANQIYRTGGEIKFNDFTKFKKVLSVKMSRFIKELKESNG